MASDGRPACGALRATGTMCLDTQCPQHPMMKIVKRYWVLFVLPLGVISATGDSALGVSTELAKRCRAMAIKAHPTKPPGSKTGSVKAQRDYFDECVTKGGKMPEISPDAKH